MDTKICSKCHLEKELNDNNFPKRSTKIGDWRAECKKCHKLYKNEHYVKNKDKILNYQKTYAKENVELLKKQKRKYYLLNKERLNNKNKIRREKNPNYQKKNYRDK